MNGTDAIIYFILGMFSGVNLMRLIYMIIDKKEIEKL